MRFVWLFVCLVPVVAVARLPETQHNKDAVVAEVISLAKAKAINAEHVDWPAVEREVDAILANDSGESGRTQAIRRVLSALEDGHSAYRPPLEQPVVQHGVGEGLGQEPKRPMEAEGSVRPPIAQAARGGKYGVLTINSWSGSPDAIPEATRTVRTELLKSLHGDNCGLVIDLSSNRGGNMWPMMGGIAPLFRDGALETFEDKAGQKQVVNVAEGVLRMNESVYPQVNDLPPVASKPKFIALLIGKRTASSGEITTLGFKGQANVRSFGQTTAGATTANWSKRLPNGGTLVLSTARILDRQGVVQHGPLIPDVKSETPLEEATAWLDESCK